MTHLPVPTERTVRADGTLAVHQLPRVSGAEAAAPPPFSGGPPPGAEGMQLRDVLVALRRRWLVVLAVCVATGGAAAVLAVREAPTYTATATLRIGDARRQLTNGVEAPEEQQDRLASPLLSQVQLLRSRSLIGAVVDSTGLRLVPDFEGFRPTLLRDVRIDPAAPADTLHLRFGAADVQARFGATRARAPYGTALEMNGVAVTIAARPETESAEWMVITRERAVDALMKRLRVKPRTQTNIVDIAYSARRPSVAQRVVNTVATLYQSTNTRAAQEQSRRRRVFLEQQLGVTDSALAAAQLALVGFQRRMSVYGSGARLDGGQRDLGQLDRRVDELQTQRRVFAALLQSLESAPEARRQQALRALIATPGIRDNLAVAEQYDRLARFQGALDSLTTGAWHRAETDPDVQRLRALLASAESQLASTVRGQLAWIDAQSRSLAASRDRNLTALDSLSSVQTEEVRLQQQVALLQRTSEQLHDGHEKARIAEAVEVGPVELVDLADRPYEPDAMLRLLKLALGVVLGLGIGGALAVFLEMRDTVIHRLDEVEPLLQVPALATIPRVGMERANGRAASRRTLGAMLRGRSAPDVPRRSAVVFPGNTSLVGLEAYRVLRTNLLFARGRDVPRSLVVTSAGPSEGKTVTSTNLAITFAQGGMRVLLVDCDLRRPQLHQVFGVPRSPGLSQLLRGSVALDPALRTTPIENLHLLTVGSHTAGTTETLRGARMLAVMHGLQERYDMVILDAPPVLAAADASVLGALADGVLMVLRAGQTGRAQAQAAMQQLDVVGASVLGAVLNDAPPDALGYPYAYFEDYREVAVTS